MQMTVNPLDLDIHYATGYAARHDVYYQDKLLRLTAAMTHTGWQGAPVVVDVEAAQAITGSHRLAAARAAGLEEVPAVDIFALAEAIGIDLYELIGSHGTLEDALPAFCAAVPPWVALAYGLDID